MGLRATNMKRHMLQNPFSAATPARAATIVAVTCVALGALGALGVLGVQSAVADTLYKCVDGDGLVLYTNQKSGARNCTVLSRDLPVTTLRSPQAKAADSKKKAASPANFPRINSDQQRRRDNDRRLILEQEYALEQQNLDKARQALAEGEASRQGDEQSYQDYLSRVQELREDVALHERNIAALTRELSNLK